MRKHVLLLALWLFWAMPNTFAAHLIGGQITYECLGNDDYRVTIKIYRDCNSTGAEFDSMNPSAMTGHVSIYRGADNEPYETIILKRPNVALIDPTLDDPCIAAPVNVCVQEGR